jgi:hypothetical protein
LARSISGAHRNLNENDRVARLKKPITASDRPASRSHSDRVSKISMKGRPDAKPRPSITRLRRSPKKARVWRRVFFSGAACAFVSSVIAAIPCPGRARI